MYSRALRPHNEKQLYISISYISTIYSCVNKEIQNLEQQDITLFSNVHQLRVNSSMVCTAF